MKMHVRRLCLCHVLCLQFWPLMEKIDEWLENHKALAEDLKD